MPRAGDAVTRRHPNVAQRGFTLVELLVALAVFGVIMAFVAIYFAQQTNVAARAQALNDAELAARTVAEAVAQDFQLAGSRATFVGGTVVYPNQVATDCDEGVRSGCVVALTYDGTGTIGSPATTADINGYAVYYRTSLAPAAPCRRVDYALVDGTLYRSDIECDETLAGINLGASAYAENVQSFAVAFECSNGSSYVDPAACYAAEADAYVRQAEVQVEVQLTGRHDVTAGMTFASLTPNLRPSVNYGLPEPEGEN